LKKRGIKGDKGKIKWRSRRIKRVYIKGERNREARER
jgi:hypothetical protein